MPVQGVSAPRHSIGEAGVVSTALETARQHLDVVEEKYFAGSARLDELRAAYEQVQAAERRVVEAHHHWNQ